MILEGRKHSMSKFKIEIHTGDQFKAGTDANIFVILLGALDRTSEYRLNGRIKGNAFERNQTDTVVLDVSESYAELGTIYGIIVRSDMKYSGAGWLLDRIEVTNIDVSNPVTSKFKIAQWIEDTRPHEFFDSSLISLDDCPARERNVVSDAVHHVPANTCIKIEDSVQTEIGFHLSETKVTEITTNTSVTAQAGASASPTKKLNLTQLKASISFALMTVSKTELAKSVEECTTRTYSQTIEFPICDTAKVYKPVYIENYEDYSIRIGNLVLQVPRVLSRRGAGYIEAQ